MELLVNSEAYADLKTEISKAWENADPRDREALAEFHDHSMRRCKETNADMIEFLATGFLVASACGAQMMPADWLERAARLYGDHAAAISAKLTGHARSREFKSN